MNAADRIRIQHMLEAAKEGVKHWSRSCAHSASGRRKDIEIIGEAANRVSAELRSSEPGIPWADIVAMRNRLIHAYFDVDPELVWKTVQEDLPDLVVELRRLLRQTSAAEPG